MLPYKNINFTYDAQALLDLYNSSNKVNLRDRINADISVETFSSPLINPFFEKYSFVPRYQNCLELSSVISASNPHINPGNNALLIFPVAGSVALNVYSFVPRRKTLEERPFIDVPNLTEDALAGIKSTLTETVEIKTPIIVNGLMTHSIAPVSDPALILVLKMPIGVYWNDVIDSIE